MSLGRTLALFAALTLLPMSALGHPGRLDSKGCHRVWKDWTSKDGKVTYRTGTVHCHRIADEVRLGVEDVRVQEDEGATPVRKGHSKQRGR